MGAARSSKSTRHEPQLWRIPNYRAAAENDSIPESVLQTGADPRCIPFVKDVRGGRVGTLSSNHPQVLPHPAYS